MSRQHRFDQVRAGFRVRTLQSADERIRVAGAYGGDAHTRRQLDPIESWLKIGSNVARFRCTVS